MLPYAVLLALFVNLSSLASSSVFSSPPEPVRNLPGEILTPMTDHFGAILRHRGGHFLCDVNAFLAHFRKGSSLPSLKVFSCRLFAEVHFCATPTRSHRLARQIRDHPRAHDQADGAYDQPSWAHLGAILGDRGSSWGLLGCSGPMFGHIMDCIGTCIDTCIGTCVANCIHTCIGACVASCVATCKW